MPFTHRVYEKYVKIWSNKEEEEILTTEAGWIIANTDLSKDKTGTVLDDWQIFNINNTSRYQIYIKSRQVGFSFIQALKKLARCALKPGYKGVFISIDRAESQQKLNYVRRAWDTVSPEWRAGGLHMKKNNSIMITYRNNSQLTSFASKAPRGQAESDLTIDEVAHVRNMHEKFAGATAIALRDPEATIELGSSPLSTSGFFYEVITDPEGIYKTFDGQRFFIHWWDSNALCKDVYRARRVAEKERWDLSESRDDIEARVLKYGSKEVQDEFYSRSSDLFRQEYECAFTSDSSSLIAIHHIRNCADTSLSYLIHDPNDIDKNKPWTVHKGSRKFVEESLAPAIEEILYEWGTENKVYVGFDPASKRHQSVITFVSPTKDNKERFRMRVLGRVVFKDTPVHIQEILLDVLAHHPAIGMVSIDRTGHAIDLCARLEEKYGKNGVFREFNFSAKVKSEIGSRGQLYFEQGLPWFPYDKDLINQIYALKRIVTRTGQESIQAPESVDNHADAGWSILLAMFYVPVPEIRREAKVTVEVSKDRSYYEARDELKAMLYAAKDNERTNFGERGQEKEVWW